MQRKFLLNLLFLLFLNLLIKPFWLFGIDRTVQNIVGDQPYGIYFSLINFSSLFYILLDLGITNFNNRNVAINNSSVGKSISNILVLKIAAGIVYVLVCIGVGLVIGYNTYMIKLLSFLLLNQILISFILYFRSNLSGLHYFKIDSFFSIFDKLLVILICSFLLWNKTLRPYFRIEWLIYSQTIAYLLTALCVYFTVLTKVKQRFSKIEFSFIKKIIRSSLPYALLFLLMSMSLRIDSVLLERLLPNGDVQAGIYAQAYRLLDAACQLGYLVAGLLLPIFAKLIYDKAKLKQIVEFSAPILLIPACIIVFILFVYRNQVMQLLYHNHIESSVTIFSILILSFIPISASYIYGTLLTANGNIKAINIIAFAGVIVNIGLNIVLIPVFQAKGSAIANLATQLVTCLAQLVLAQRLFKLKIIYKRTLFFIVIMIIVGLIISNLLIYWVLGAVITATVSIIIAFGLKVLNLKSIYEILRYKEL